MSFFLCINSLPISSRSKKKSSFKVSNLLRDLESSSSKSVLDFGFFRYILNASSIEIGKIDSDRKGLDISLNFIFHSIPCGLILFPNV